MAARRPRARKTEPADAADAQPLDAAALRQKALRLLARRERSRAEIAQLLGRYCDDEGAISAVVAELQAAGWLSESRLATSLVLSRRSRAGAARIRQELARRGVARDVIAESTRGLEAGDLEAAMALWRRRFGTPAADRSGRERQMRFLLNRGFSRAVAAKVLRAAQSTDGDDDPA